MPRKNSKAAAAKRRSPDADTNDADQPYDKQPRRPRKKKNADAVHVDRPTRQSKQAAGHLIKKAFASSEDEDDSGETYGLLLAQPAQMSAAAAARPARAGSAAAATAAATTTGGASMHTSGGRSATCPTTRERRVVVSSDEEPHENDEHNDDVGAARVKTGIRASHCRLGASTGPVQNNDEDDDSSDLQQQLPARHKVAAAADHHNAAASASASSAAVTHQPTSTELDAAGGEEGDMDDRPHTPIPQAIADAALPLSQRAKIIANDELIAAAVEAYLDAWPPMQDWDGHVAAAVAQADSAYRHTKPDCDNLPDLTTVYGLQRRSIEHRQVLTACHHFLFLS